MSGWVGGWAGGRAGRRVQGIAGVLEHASMSCKCLLLIGPTHRPTPAANPSCPAGCREVANVNSGKPTLCPWEEAEGR